MAVPISNVTRRQVYAPSGTGGAGPYAFTFEILANTDIAVFKDDTLLTLTTHYTVTINANGTGSVTITATGLALAPTSPTQYAIVGNRTISRTTDFTTGGDFFANVLNDELDQQTIFAQQNAEGLQRALVAPQTDPTSINMVMPRASLRANKILAFDANGNPVIGDTVGTNRGNWAAGTLYYVRDLVKDTSNSNIYQVITQHTSSGSQPISSNVDVAKWALLVDAAAAAASASAAASSASAASTSASNASTSASNASTSASNASTSATNAASSASAASTSATNAAASYDSFDDRYLGPKASPPTLDNDGNALLTGALYFDTTLNLLQVYSGTAWVSIVSGPTSSTDNAIARFDGTTGKLVQNSVVTIADTTGNMTGVGAMGIGTPTISSGYSLDVQNGLVLARMESTTGVNAALFLIKNTAGNTIFGNQGSTASTFTGAYNYATVFGTDSARALQFATNNTVRFEVNSDGAFYNYGSMTIATTLGVTGGTTLSSTLTYGGVTLTNAVTGTGKMVLDTSPTFTTSVIGGATMAVFNTTSTTVNAFGAATAVNIGAATGTLTVANTTLAAKAITASTTLGVTGDTSLATTPVLYSGDGSVSSGRLLGRYSYRTATPTTAYYYDLNNTNTITSADSLAANKLATLIDSTITNANALTAFGTSYGGKAAGLSFVSGTASDILLASVGSAPLLNADINAVVVGYTSVGPRIAIQNYALNDDTANAISYIGAVHRFYPAGTEVVKISSTGLAVTGTLSATGTLSGGTSGTGYSFSGSAPATSLTLDSSGNLGIGTSSPNGKLDVASGNVFITQDYELNWHTGGTKRSQIIGDSSNNLKFSNRVGGVLTNTMTLDSSGNLGLGVTPSAWSTSYSQKAFQFGPVGSLMSLQASSSNNQTFVNSNAVNLSGGWTYMYSDAASQYQQYAGQHRWLNAPSGTAGNAITFTQAMSLLSDGAWCLGSTTTVASGFAGVKFNGSGYNGLGLNDSAGASGAGFIYFQTNGTTIGTITRVGATSAVAYNVSSDYRLKNITGPITASGAYIDSLNPVEGTWKVDGSTFVGLIAHEVQESSRTQTATGVKDGEEMQAMDYSNPELIANLIAELQSLRARVAQLESKP